MTSAPRQSFCTVSSPRIAWQGRCSHRRVRFLTTDQAPPRPVCHRRKVTRMTSTLPETMPASVLTGPEPSPWNRFRLPAVASDEVLVEVAAVGVCGSDTHYFRHGRIGDFVVDGPADPRPRAVRPDRRGRLRGAGVPDRRAGRHRAAEATADAAASAEPAATTSARTWSSTPRRRSTARSPSTAPSAPSSPTACRTPSPTRPPPCWSRCRSRSPRCARPVVPGLEHPDRRRRADRHHLRSDRAGLRRGRDHRHRPGRRAPGAGSALRRHPGDRPARGRCRHGRAGRQRLRRRQRVAARRSSRASKPSDRPVRRCWWVSAPQR